MAKKLIIGCEAGVLLDSTHEEYPQYSCNNPALPYGFYDEDQEEFPVHQMERYKEQMMEYVKNGVDRTYAILSKQAELEEESERYREILTGAAETSLDYSYFRDADSIIWSICKIDGVLYEGFLEKLLAGTFILVEKEKETMSDVKTGSWYVQFELTLDGESVRWDDLSETTQEHILECIKGGSFSGEIVEG